ncbi:hypothetical protein EVAR_77308_1 [Eumeta japonica]|uniref:MADF domain-containing protein n=1 Tax=Eumeta variegata TaxID=151549 RepID=A0A4C1UN34_EUMVA|nr:hypothetical protein EVAR_77308_1 [Eumeta japonica]
MEWHKEKTLYFIEKYREEEVLWNPADREHYNKLKKEDAWNRLASLLDSERQTCKNKMTSLLASLRREKQKTKQSTSTGKSADEVYHSTWFAYKAIIFLLDRNTPRAITDTLREREGASEQPPDDCPPPANKSDNDCPPPSRKRKKAVAPSPEEIMASTFNILKKRTEQTESTSHKLDECEAYGYQSIATTGRPHSYRDDNLWGQKKYLNGNHKLNVAACEDLPRGTLTTRAYPAFKLGEVIHIRFSQDRL